MQEKVEVWKSWVTKYKSLARTYNPGRLVRYPSPTRPISKPISKLAKSAVVMSGSSPVLKKHTFGRRLRDAGVSFEDRQDLLGHRSGRITTNYSAAELSRLLEAANSVCESSGKKPELVVLRRLISS